MDGLYRALLDCLADLSYSITLELLASVPPVVCTVFERLGNTMVDDTHARYAYGPLQIRSNDSQDQCLSDNTTIPCSTAGMLYSLAQWA